MPLLTIQSLIDQEQALQVEGLSITLLGRQARAGVYATTAQYEAFAPVLDSAQAAGFLAWSVTGSSSPLDIMTVSNGDTVSLELGMAVALLNGRLRRAGATSPALAAVQGIIVQRADVTLPAQVQVGGVVTLPASAWVAVVDEPGGLVADARYYISSNLGFITTTPVSTQGYSLMAVGRAVSDTVLNLRLLQSVYL